MPLEDHGQLLRAVPPCMGMKLRDKKPRGSTVATSLVQFQRTSLRGGKAGPRATPQMARAKAALRQQVEMTRRSVSPYARAKLDVRMSGNKRIFLEAIQEVLLALGDVQHLLTAVETKMDNNAIVSGAPLPNEGQEGIAPAPPHRQ